jgi:tetratricopeptide (TPR) repeat protein
MQKFGKAFFFSLLTASITSNAWAITNFAPDYSDQDLRIDSAEKDEIFPNSPLIDHSSKAQLERLTKALKKFPDSAMLYAERAQVYADMDQYDNALKDIDEAVKVHPERESYYWSRAQIQMHLKNYKAALADCTLAKQMAPGFRCWISDLIRAQIYKSMGSSNESKVAAQEALNSMANYGASDDFHHNELEKLLNGQTFKPERKTEKSTQVVEALAKLSQLDKPPSDELLAKILGLTESDLQRPLKSPNEHLYFVKADHSPWLRIRKDYTETPVRCCALEVHLDSDICSLNEADLKTKLNAFESKPEVGVLASPGGPERLLNATGEHCRVTFILQPGGFQSLSSAQFTWN